MLEIVTLANCDVLLLTISPQSNMILEEYKDVFEGLGELPGKYKIITDERVKPTVHPPRRIPVALCPKIKEKLEISTAKRHHASNRANRMGLKYMQLWNLFGPKGLERSDQVRTLPDTYYRRDHYSTWQSKAFHSS